MSFFDYYGKSAVEGIKYRSLLGLQQAFDRMNEDEDGMYGKSANWTVVLGGYDMGYVISYKGYELLSVNYEYHEYEIERYGEYLRPEILKEMMKILECSDFECTNCNEDEE